MTKPDDTESSSLDSALATLNSDDLRRIIRRMGQTLSGKDRLRLKHEIEERAVRSGRDWRPPGVDRSRLLEIRRFAEVATAQGYADSWDVNRILCEGRRAFLRKDYADASEIYGAILPPIFCGDIDLGHDDEGTIEVKLLDEHLCRSQYVVSRYMTAGAALRVQVVYEAILGMGPELRPLNMLEQTAVEPLPEFDRFSREWLELVEKQLQNRDKGRRWDDMLDHWRREVLAPRAGTLPRGFEMIPRRQFGVGLGSPWRNWRPINGNNSQLSIGAPVKRVRRLPLRRSRGFGFRCVDRIFGGFRSGL